MDVDRISKLSAPDAIVMVSSAEWMYGIDWSALAKAAVLGVVEGATEFIPVSSTGHLILVQDWLDFTGAKEDAFLIFIQLGAILAVVWLYRAKLWGVVCRLHRDPTARQLAINLIVGTIPAVIIGLPTKDWIREHFFAPFPVGVALMAGGVAILLIERLRKQPRVDAVDRIPTRLAWGVGLFQVLAILFPGVSRSGATIMGGLVLGLSRTAAAEFSFFLAIPAMFGASVVELAGVRREIGLADVPVFAVGFGVSFLAAVVVVRVLLAFVAHRSFAPFAWYRILLGAIIIGLYGKGFPPA